MSNAAEGLFEEHLANQGDPASAGILDAYRSARTMLAKVHDAKDALNGATGDFSARLLGRIFDESPNKLSGGMKTVGQMATAFPKYVRDNMESYPAISPLDTATAVIGSVMSGNPAPAALPVSRVAARAYLMSQSGQAGAIQSPSGPVISPAALQSFFGIGLPSLWQGISK